MAFFPIPQLDNIFWQALSGTHARFASGTATARRYARGFSPIVGFRDPEHPDFGALAAFCDPGEQFYCDGWCGPAVDGWRIDAEATMFRMVWTGAAPPHDPADVAVALDTAHASRAMALAVLTKPGPFGPRTIELGDYFGHVEDGQLVAMAGERTAAPGLREISGVCTRPGYQGRGLARRLMLKLVRRQLARGETPFLHVMSANARAHQLYLDMGFRDERETVVRVLTRV
jgi:ribosomal protein S18 acetylase RimI-like enzyme